MNPLTLLPITAHTYRSISEVVVSVPDTVKVVECVPGKLVVEGNPPDTQSRLDQWIRVTFEFDERGHIEHRCRYSRKWTYSYANFPKKRRGSGARCKTAFIWLWMMRGFTA